MDKNEMAENELRKIEATMGEFNFEDKAALKTAFKSNQHDIIAFKIAKYLIKTFNVKTINEHDQEIFLYQNGKYVKGVSTLKKWLQEHLEEECKTHAKKEIIEKVRDLSAVERKEFAVSRNFINLNNGIFDIENDKLISHDPKFLFFNKIPVDYVEGASCPAINKFLHSILGKKEIAIIQEWAGYMLYRIYFIKKAIIFVGERNTGKTTLLRLLVKFIGEENVSGISLQKMTSDKFSASSLYNKMLNSYDDLSSSDIKDNGAFKIATGGGYISAEYKYGNRFEFENYAKLMFASNMIPDVREADDDAYFDRWIIIRFNREIRKLNKFLMDEITKPEELSGFLNFALEGLHRLLKNQVFSYKKDPKEIKREMMSSGSSVATFSVEKIINEANAWISKDETYRAFVKYATQKDLTVLTKKDFGYRLKKHAPYIKSGKHKIGNKQITGWWNLKVTDIGLLDPPPLEDYPEDPIPPTEAVAKKANSTNSTML